MNLPEEYLKKMKFLLKDEYEDYIKSFDEKRYFGIRVNNLKISSDKLKEKLNINLTPVKWCDNGFYYDEGDRPAKNPYYYAGLYYIQEPSAMSTGAMLDIKPGDRVLDLCAAPGGKSTQAGVKLKNKGILLSNDVSASRCKALLKNIELFGISNAVVTNETPEKLSDRFAGFFNKIIVDAPCSGEGMFRKDSSAIKSWDTHKTETCCLLQAQILENASKMLCRGGTIAYSTCTFAPEENEKIINDFLNKNHDFELVEVDKKLGFEAGKNNWINEGRQDLRKCGRLWPHKIKGEGHFIALLKKEGEYEEIELENHVENRKDIEEFYNFENENLNIKFEENIIVHGKSLMKMPCKLNFDGIRVVRSGLYLGDIKTKRFEPSQALAMALSQKDVKNVISFSPNDENLYRYLKGESFKIEGKNGWNLVCIDEFPLGWAKIQDGRLKNKYLSGWRMMS